MKAIIYKITCLTNLHVGNGESNFDIIDNAVEKDPVTGLPTINSSGIKGALRQYFKEKGVENCIITSIFGSDQKTAQEQDKARSIPGKVKFYQADLLARPTRASVGGKTNYMVTSEEAIGIYDTKAAVFRAKSISRGHCVDNEIGIEGISHQCVQNIGIIDQQTVILADSTLRDLPLPVLARNQLDNGISKNLWYEQVVPHKSIFTFAVSSDDEDVLKRFAEVLKNEAYIQFGGNATIGYGLCRVERMEAAHE